MSSSVIEHKRFDLILCSQELKKEIKKRIVKLNVSLFNLCKQLDFNYEWVRHWMNTSEPLSNNRKLKQWHAIRLAESLGIDIRITIVIKPLNTAYAIPYAPVYKQPKEQVNGG